MTEQVSTLFEWMGGTPMLTALIDRFYERIPTDEQLAPLFARASAEHLH